MKLCFALPRFFTIPWREVVVEVGPVTGLQYLVHKGRVVAIAERSKELP